MSCQGSQVSKTNLLWSTLQGDVSVVFCRASGKQVAFFMVGALWLVLQTSRLLYGWCFIAEPFRDVERAARSQSCSASLGL